MRLSLCVIAKNEEENLPRLLSSVRGVVDEIVLVDTGSTDRTVEVGREFGARVFSFPWTGDFSEARNFSLDQATGDWILFLDADEELVEGEGERLRKLLEEGVADAYSLVIVNFVGEREGIDAVLHSSVRVFRNRPEYRFRGRIHEQIVLSIQEHGGRIEFTDIKINHYGYLSGLVRGKKKISRNLALLERAVRESPRDPFNRYNLGVEYLRQRDFAAALREFQAAFRYLPSLAVSYASVLVRNIVLCLVALGCYDEALKVLADAKEAYPDYTDLLYCEGCVYLNQGDLERARASFEECLARGESASHHITQRGVGSYLAWCSLGQLEEQKGNFEVAKSAYARALECHPKFYPALARLTSLLLRSTSPEEALRELLSHLNLEDEEACLIAAHIFASQGHHEQALELLDEALRRHPSSSRLCFARGGMLLQLRRYAEAAEALSAVSPSSQVYPLALLNRVLALTLGGDLAGASQALETLPEEHALARRLYRAWLDRLAGEESLPALLPGEEEEAKETLLELLGRLLALEAFDEFERALPLFFFLPEPPRRLELGKLYFRHGFAELAAEEIIAAVRGGARDAEGFAILGKVAAEKGFHEEAVVFYRQALEEGKGDFSWYTALIKELTFLGRYAEAAEVVKEGLKVFPQNELLQSLLPLLQKMGTSAEVKGSARGEGRSLN
ncbi:glycosyl transferase family 2 [Ammonifex degensii KC4]|uniref:Glycosyl transferase family 2 n=1 Tax=Ammonifex degensii (strain DSM 10501 / KC4) TaxID=429009 RepID=C9RAZ4_AMMDK|nr:TPR domain-containing glycosyltransferase [Ammonifex degensii]ACX51421.1 glycosyl transferase family 2 [Ammonifex degensii KC4]